VLLTLAAGLLGGIWVGRGVMRRLTQVTQAADTIMAGDFSGRISEEHHEDEFEALAQKLNAMLARIQALMQAQRDVTENVAHDLRSPLGRLRTRLESLLLRRAPGDADREALLKAMEDTDRVVATLNAILNIAEIEAKSRARWQDTDLAELCRDLAELYGPLAEEKKLSFETRLADRLVVSGNRQMLAQALNNLLDNAIKYTPPGGRIVLGLRAEGGEAVISVTDSGPGIPEHLRQKVLERFVRLDESRSRPGNGLGLSLVKAIAEHHGAGLSLGDNRPGLEVLLRLRMQVPREVPATI
jgi:signal transduction histidine kinase